MGKNTGISWTDHTWNCWTGCQKVSSGCAQCYMFSEQTRYGNDPAVIRRTSANNWKQPYKWQREQQKIYESNGYQEKDRTAKVFLCSWSDFFIEEADEWRKEAWDVIRDTCNKDNKGSMDSRDNYKFHPYAYLTWQICTKRPERIAQCLPKDWGNGWQHVWLGVTAENQQMANKRIPILLNTPAAVRWLSCEPLLGDISLMAYLFTVGHLDQGINCEDDRGIDWVVGGAESGSNRRNAEMEWFRSLRDQCALSDTPYFLKQMDNEHGVLTKEPMLDGEQYLDFPKE